MYEYILSGVSMQDDLKRISLMIRTDQHRSLQKKASNYSALIRDLIDDHLSSSQIILSMSAETRDLYEEVIAITGATDEDLERPFRKALADFLDQRMEDLRQTKEKLR